MVGKRFKSDEESHSPDLASNTKKQPLIESLRDPSPQQQIEDEDNRRRDSEQVGLEGGETQRLQLQTDVAACWNICDHPGQTEEVNDPHVVVLKGLPEHARRNSLAVVHTSLARVVPENTVDHDFFLVFGEPSLLTAEPASGLGWGWWHPERSNNADHTGDQTFEGK